MEKTFVSQSGLSSPRLLIGLFFCVAGVFLACAGLGQNESPSASQSAPVAHVTWAAEPFSKIPGNDLGPKDEGSLAVVAPATRSTIFARWDSIPGALGYRLDVSTSNSFSTYVSGYQDLDVGNVFGRIVTGLSRDTTYYYRVRARYAFGMSAHSDARTATTVPTGGLTINPTFDNSILNDPDAAAIQSMINQAIGIYESLFDDPMTIQIRFRYSTTAPDGSPLGSGTLAQSNTCVYPIPWNDFITALRASATTSNDAIANAGLPGTPLSTNIKPSSAGGRAVGLGTAPATFADSHCAAGGSYDGIVTLNSGQSFQFTRPPTADNYDALRATEHEIDEVMGLGSFLNIGILVNDCATGDLRPQDLFNWSSSGNRNFCRTGSRYFSINNGSTNIVNFSQLSCGDFGDWRGNASDTCQNINCPQSNPYVQNAFSCSGQFSDVTATSPEGINLDVVGYDLGSAPTPRTLTVASTNPSSGVGVTVSPNDNNGQGSGTTQFTRVYNNNQSVSLSAPSTASGNNFQKWQRDGSDWSTSTSTTVTMDANHTMTAVYTTAPPPTRTLTVASSNPNGGVGVTVSPNDNNGQGSGTTQFTRVYNLNQSVSLTAPPTASGNNFQKWQRDGFDWSTSASTTVTMDSSHTMTAVYGTTPTPTPGCSPTITQSSTQAITATNSASCNSGTAHKDNSYWRAFNMGTFVGSNQYNVTSVSFGVEQATGAGGTQPVTVRLYTNGGGAFPGGTRSQIASSTVNVPDSASGTVFTAPLVATVPAGAELVMEVFTPDGTVAGNLLFIGSNADPESGPSYLSAADCGFATPTTTAGVGFPNMHIVFNVNGGCGGGPPPSPTPTATPCGTTATFSNPAPITINDDLPANPYPSNITVAGVANSVTKVTVTITGFNHTFPSDVDMVLVGPGGQKFILVSDVIGGTDAAGINWTLDDAAAAFIGSTGAPASGTFKPTNYTTCQDAFAAPAPNGPYLTPGGIGTPCGADTLAAFNGVNPNGIWSLYVVDDVGADIGSISGGWSVSITTAGSGCATLGNISTRLRVETGNNVLIGGFIITGTQPKRIIVRAIGPSLPFPGTLANPILELRDSSGGLIFSDDNWRTGGQEAEIIATGIPPTNDLESAIVATLPANSSAYTATVRGVNNGTGIGVVEVYDLNQTVNSKLANISTRGLVQTGDNVMIGGLIVLGQSPLRVIVRAIGPSLPVAGALGDPTLELRDGSGTLLAFDDDWRDGGQEAEIIATGVPPSADLESAIVRNLTPGNYTAIVRGFNSTTGVALVEAYGLN